MNRCAVGDDGRPPPALVRDGHVRRSGCRVAGRPLADDGVVGRETVLDSGLTADATRFLADERGEDQFARRVGVPEGEHRRGDAPFHVRRAAAVESAVALLDDVLAVGTDLRPVRWDHIVVADEGERVVARPLRAMTFPWSSRVTRASVWSRSHAVMYSPQPLRRRDWGSTRGHESRCERVHIRGSGARGTIIRGRRCLRWLAHADPVRKMGVSPPVTLYQA